MKQETLPLPVDQAQGIESVIDLEKVLEQAVNISSIYNRAVNVDTIELRHGMQGNYIIMSVTEILNGEQSKVACGGTIVMNVMTKIDAQHKFPVSCVFYKAENSNAILLRPVQDSDLTE